MRRSRLQACVVLAGYLAAAIALPVLHRRHHALHGADHVHGAFGTVYFAAPSIEDAAFHHAAFDADLAALELADVAHAGTAAVDCALAEYTLVVCDDPASSHAHNFGDQLLAHAHSRPPQPIDPAHGSGALEHLGASLLGAAPFTLPPPARPMARLPVEESPRAFASAPRFTHAPRGPPAG
ncbi:MAG TPA: hypothetical protein VFF06_27315 [Polyangia bacterium]|nr:hypothetical protein [Polyangia bacterium]